MKKEPGPYFHLSLGSTKIEELFNLNIGFYKIPTLAYYGENYPYGGNPHLDPLCIIESPGALINLPDHVLNILQTCENTYMSYPPPTFKGKWVPRPISIPIPHEIEFYWIVSDRSDLLHVKPI